MVTTKEMKNAVHNNCKIIYKSGLIKEGYVEEFHHAESEEEEPLILYTPKLAAFQSELERIEIL